MDNSTTVKNAYVMSTELLPDHVSTPLPSHLPLVKRKAAVEASLSSSSPQQLIEVLNFLFLHTCITAADKETLNVFKTAKPMNDIVLTVFADQFLYSLPLYHPNLPVLVSLASVKAKDEFFTMLAELVSAGIDKSAFDLACNLVKSKQYNLPLVSSVYHTYEEQGAVPKNVGKLYNKAVEADTNTAVISVD